MIIPEQDAECEIRFAADERAADALLASPFIRRLAVDERIEAETAVYYDTPRYRLRKLGILLQVRQVQGAFEQRVTLTANEPENLLMRSKSSVPVAGPGPDFEMASFLLGKLGHRLDAADLRAVFTTRLQCRRVLVKWRGALIEVACHHGEFARGNRGEVLAPIQEINLALKRGTPADLVHLALALNERAAWRQIGGSRADLGFAAISQRLKPVIRKSRPVPIEGTMSAGAAFRRIATETLAQFLANDPAMVTPQAEAVHQSRVAIRRLRAALNAFKAALPYGERKAFNSEFRWLQQSLGKSRDWHIFQTETLPAIPGLSDRERSALDALAAARQSRFVKAGIETLASRRANRLLLNFQYWLHSLDIHGGELARPAGKFAARLLRKSFRRLADSGRLDSRRRIEELHAVRISGKKLRYALEFFAGSPAGRRFAPALPGLKALQKHLGNANDAATALALLAHERPASANSSARRCVEAWAAARICTCVAAAQPGMRLTRRIFSRGA